MIVQTNVPYHMVRENIHRIVSFKVDIEVYFNNATIDRIDSADVKETGSILKDAGISCTVHAPFMDLSPGAVDQTIRTVTGDKLVKAVEMANLLGARGIVCHSGYNKWYFDGKQDVWLEGSVETWNRVLSAGGKELPVMVENIFEEEPSNLIELFKYFKESNLYFCFDSGHFNLFTITGIQEWLQPLKNKIREMHLHDNHGNSDEHLPIGAGTFPFHELKQFIRQLDQVIFTAEIHGEAAAPQGIKILKEFLS